MGRNYDTITFILKYYALYKRFETASFADIIIISKIQKIKSVRNFALRCNFYLYSLILKKNY